MKISGIICSVPTTRLTPLGRTITRFIVSSESNYIPCISLKHVSVALGDHIELSGRMLNNELMIEQIKKAPAKEAGA